jgi:hypothetical protein
VRISFVVKASGPVFNGAWIGIMNRYKYKITEVIGNEAVNRIRAYLPTQYQYLRNPGSLGWHKTKHFHPGLYTSDIHTDRASVSVNLVHDTRVTYGPWLEGVGSRNATTRFKGYHTFRIIATELNTEAADIAERELPPYLAELNA